jgi:polar amino acid transport system substrate-binding protein
MSSILPFGLFLILAMSTPFSISFASASEPLTIITEEWPPFNYTENDVLKGFSTEVVQLVMKDLNVNDKIIVLPGPRAMKVFNKFPRSIFFSFILTPERKPQYKWIGPFGEQSIYFYKKKGSTLKIHSLDDAKKVTSICTRESGLVFSTLKAAGFKNLDVGVNPEGIYLKTIKGRCALAIGETPLGVAFWLKKSNQFPDSLEQTPLVLLSSPLYIVASKDIPDEEIARWQKSLDKIKASKEYSQLQQKYSK